MAYTKTVWVNNQSPAISDTNLNKIEQGIFDNDAAATAAQATATAAVPKSLVTTAGDLLYATASSVLARLGIGAVGTVLGGGASAPAWITPPGAELSYAQITAPVTIASTTEATGTTIVTAGAVVVDGATTILVEFEANTIGGTATAAGAFIELSLFEGATQITRLAEYQIAAASAGDVPCRVSYRITPSAGSHTYSVTAFKSANWTSAAVTAGSGGTAGYSPAFIRVTKV